MMAFKGWCVLRLRNRNSRSARHSWSGDSLASFCRQTHGFRAGVEFSAENRPESAPRTAFGREHGGVFGAYLICSRWSVCERGHQQNTPLRSRQEAGGNGIIMIVTAGNGQARHKG